METGTLAMLIVSQVLLRKPGYVEPALWCRPLVAVDNFPLDVAPTTVTVISFKLKTNLLALTSTAMLKWQQSLWQLQ